MAWTGLLAEVRPPADADYVASFQRLADLHLDLKQRGPSRRLLLQKSILEAAVGNYAASRRTARDAVALDQDDAEGLFRLGIACLWQAYVEAGAVSAVLQESDRAGVLRLLDEGEEALERAAEANPHDKEAGELLQRVRDLRADRQEESEVVAWLISEAVDEGASRPQRPKRGAS